MIFNEIYGCYYNAVSKIISQAIDGTLTESKMQQIVSEYAFEESSLSIIPALINHDWQLLDDELHTPVVNKPTMPMTTLEKRWLKTILLDPRIALFQIPAGEMKDVEPLFYPEDIVYFDRYLDGDRYDDPAYIANFYIILQAIREHRKIKVRFYNNHHQEKVHFLKPIKLEYSDKEDKFRVLCAGKWDIRTINLGRIISCERMNETFPADTKLQKRTNGILTFELKDERNALERAMMKFAHFRKEVERIGEDTYHVELEYDLDDETDVLIQVMSFGRYVKILSPENMKEELARRLTNQLKMLDWN